MTTEIKLRGEEIRVGDVMRFRMSKLEPMVWLKVLEVRPSGKRTWVGLERNCGELVSNRNKCDFRWVRREVE